MPINNINGMPGISGLNRGLTSSGRNTMLSMTSANQNSALGSNMLDSMIKDAQVFLSTAGTEAGKLKNTLADMLGKGKKENAVFDRMTAVSSDTNALRIKSATGKTVSDTKVLIDQVAITQRNTGTALSASATAPANGTYRFEIEVDGRKHRISFATGNKETNQTFQQKMAEAINKANIGVTAAITTYEDGKRSTLNIETKTTGAAKDNLPRFNIKDLTGDAVARTGVGNVTQAAQDAVYSVNGGEKITSKTNDVELGNGVTATLINASDKEVTIALGKDTIGMQNGARAMVNQFNKLLEAARNNGTDKQTRQLVRTLESMVRTSRNGLRNIGISLNDKGYLTIDPEKMKTAAENGTIEKFFIGDGRSSRSTFVRRLERVASEVSANPTRHVSPTLRRLPGMNAQVQGSGKDQAIFDKYNPQDYMSILFDTMR